MFSEIYAALMASSPSAKCEQAKALYLKAQREFSDADADKSPVRPIAVPGRPLKPELISPRYTKQRGFHALQGRQTLLHAVAHIEFNAINLALDAAWRFRGMPTAYYLDWLSVACDEARHFEMLSTHLNKLGIAYGDLTAHNGLWDAACKTDDDVMVRMALVPRVLEARGLDVTPAMIEKLRAADDHASADILSIILEEEVGHVAIGSRWFNYCCEQRGLNASETFIDLLRNHPAATVRGPLNTLARSQAGFSEWELQALAEMLA